MYWWVLLQSGLLSASHSVAKRGSVKVAHAKVVRAKVEAVAEANNVRSLVRMALQMQGFSFLIFY